MICRCLSASLVLLALNVPSGFAQSQNTSVGYNEAQVKAAFLFRLPKFIRWPDGRTSYHFCFEQESAVFETLKVLANSASLGTQVSILGEEPDASCDVIFNANASFNAREHHHLLVSDTKNFANEGGMIEISRRGSRLHLLINTASLERVDLIPSSQLLKLSTLVSSD